MTVNKFIPINKFIIPMNKELGVCGLFSPKPIVVKVSIVLYYAVTYLIPSK